jgi:sortase A
MISRVHRVHRILSVALMTAGLVVLADVGITLAWKEPLSSIYGSIKQDEAADELAALEERFPSPADLRALSGTTGVRARVERLADLFEDQVARGEGIGRIEIPSIGLDIVVVEGTDTASLQKGPGRYPSTGFPGQRRTMAIAGHRTTYLAPFNEIDEIADGDEITLEMPYATFIYRVQKHEIVEPSRVDVVRDVGYDRLVLTACHPLYSAAQRWVVFAKLDRVSLFAPGDGIWQDP